MGIAIFGKASEKLIHFDKIHGCKLSFGEAISKETITAVNFLKIRVANAWVLPSPYKPK
jgi:hypothetical protein